MGGSIRDLRKLITISQTTKSYAIGGHEEANTKSNFAVKVLSNEPSDSPKSECIYHIRNNSDSEISSKAYGLTKTPSNHKHFRPSTKTVNKTKMCATYHKNINSVKHDLRSMPPLHLEPLNNKCNDSSYGIILDNLNSEVITNWLITSNTKMKSLTSWISKSTNFCKFCHFWLSVASEDIKEDAINREHSLFVEELKLAISMDIPADIIMESKLQSLVKVVFHEYPEGFKGLNGNKMFLKYLSILTSTERIEYKKLLADVRCYTACKHHIQNVLAIRSFALVSIFSGVVDMYTKHPTPSMNDIKKKKIESNRAPEILDADRMNAKRILEAIKLSYLDVVMYLIESKSVQLDCKDDGDKTLFFHAVITNNKNILEYLLQQLNDSNSHLVNESADSGNSPLHASMNMNHTECTTLLLSCPFVDVNVVNDACHGSTPLHLAIMHGHLDVAVELLNRGADPSIQMRGMTSLEMAETFATEPDMAALLKDRLRGHEGIKITTTT